MIYDTFLFCHEHDLLDIRLKILDPCVDKFILMESPFTHKGDPKPLFFDRKRFPSDKIIHIVYREPPVKKTDDFTLESQQRQALYDTVRQIVEPDDLILMGDVDEIPSREVFERLDEITLPATLSQDFYYYNIHTPMGKTWLGTNVFKMSHKLPKDYLMRKGRIGTGIKAGWHFSYFMSIEEMAYKLGAFSHATTYGMKPWNTREHIEGHMKNHTSFLKKKLGNEKFDPIPQYVINALPEQYK